MKKLKKLFRCSATILLLTIFLTDILSQRNIVFGALNDVNGDGIINAADVELLMRYMAYYDFEEQKSGMDIELDDEIERGLIGALTVSEEAEYAEERPSEVVHMFSLDGTVEKSETTIAEDGTKKVETTVFSSTGNINKYVVEDFNASDLVTQHSEYVCNADGNFVPSCTYDIFWGDVSFYSLYEYDDNGQRIKSSEYDVDNVLLSYTVFMYDKNGREIGGKNYDGNGKVTGSYTLELYCDGTTKKRIIFDAVGNIINSSEYEYYDNGEIRKYVRYNASGDVMIFSESEYEYYDNGKKKKQIVYNADGNVSYEYEYYDNGRQKKYTAYETKGEVRMCIKYRDDGKPLLRLLTSQHGGNGLRIIRVEEYEYHDNYSITRYYTNDVLQKYVMYTYDENHLCIKSSEYNANDVLQSYTLYTYDENGWENGGRSFDGNNLLTGSYECEYFDYCVIKKRTEYDATGKFTLCYEYNKNGVPKKYSYILIDEYDNNGQRVNEFEYSADGIKEKQTSYAEGNVTYCIEYYENGKTKKQTWYDDFGDICKYFEHNEDGLCIKQTYIEVNGDGVRRISVEIFDEEGRCIKHSEYDSNNVLLYYILYYYDGEGRIREEVYDASGKMISVRTIFG